MDIDRWYEVDLQQATRRHPARSRAIIDSDSPAHVMPSPPSVQQNSPPSPLSARLLLLCGLLLAALAYPLSAYAAPTDEQIREAVEAVLANNRFQTELPNDATVVETEVDTGPRWRFELPDGLSGLARLLMWLLIAAGSVLVVIFVVNELTSLRRRARGGAQWAEDAIAKAERHAAEPGSRTSLDAADRLARNGEYGEALHMLLLDCIAQLRRLRFESLIAPSMTSRELASQLTLPEPSAEALSSMVSAVELSHFGGRQPEEQDYANCRESYLRIASESGGAS